jgi:TolB-like protein
VGTPQYMAPEQAMAEVNIDARADLYALGVMGYEMLTGHPVFEATTAQAILSAHVLEQPKDVRERRPEVPPILAEALLKCLAKNPADRWQSADDLLAQLELVASTPSGGVTPTMTRPYQAAKGKPVAKSSRKGLLIGAVAAVVIATGVASALLLKGGGGSHGIQRIAVMPIEDISGKDAMFVDAMQDALTTALNKLGTVGVAPRSAMATYKKSPKPTRDVARELSLDAVLEATVFRSGDVMRINMQFSDPATTRSLWSETYERDVKNVLAAQSEIVNLTAQAVAKVLGGAGK